ncbi:hypothetical protein GTP91_28340 [Rugamonas sp. FT82W]|uniref:Uncharacterized protein n=1 Tax=Duganella vulcania TaxID=2692166 RepID=A0A845GAZ8_9BURK|nr:hypothetical protein [Duganella vulcania]MYM91071.1 hypothetical protein [Duganella vulcania]
MFSAILAISVRARNWGMDLNTAPGNATVEEIQCMTLGVEGLYIAANHTEQLSIVNFLNAWGVSDHASFLQCLRYSYWLLAVPHSDKSEKVGKGYDLNLGAAQDVVANAGVSRARYLPSLSDDEQHEVRRLVLRENCSALSPDQQRLAWFLKRFTAERALEGVVGLTRNTKTRFTCASAYQPGKDLVLVEANSAVHAELKLLALMAAAAVEGTLAVNNRSVTIAGLKIACKGCHPWIKRFKGWIEARYGATITYEETRIPRPLVAPVADPPVRVVAEPLPIDVRAAASGFRPPMLSNKVVGSYVAALFKSTETTASFVDVDDEVDADSRRPRY